MTTTGTRTGAVDPMAALLHGDQGPAPEAEVARDLIRRALPFAPAPMLVAGVVAGVDGALSAGLGIVLVLVNFAAAAASLAWAARINLGVLMGVSLFGYLVRVSALFGAVLVLRGLAWVHVPSLGITLVLTHLGLLAWELRYVSASLAYPGLKPVSSPGASSSSGIPHHSAHKEPHR